MQYLTAEQWLKAIDAIGVNHEEPSRLGHYLALLSYSVEQITDASELQAIADTEQEHFLGQYASPADFAEESLGNAYGYELDALPSMIRNAIDWAQVWDRDYRHDCLDLEINDGTGYTTLIWHAH
jgi:hypothetical protein